MSAPEFTVEMAEEVLVKALEVGDMEAVEKALRFIAVRDAKRIVCSRISARVGLAMLIEQREAVS